MRNESGRSMVEMLGTLAIMGILAMTGVWAYNAAMDKLRADTLINEAQKRAVNVAGQISLYGRTNPTLGEFKENTLREELFQLPSSQMAFINSSEFKFLGLVNGCARISFSV